ncbi:MAG: hypothetical protein E7645_05740 [Ruminococcaceae bacterium]|nr:hypothetical protein [Oscillospiraceae bacterium]
MLEVLPIQNKTEQEAMCARCEMSYHADDMAYKAMIDGELMGVCQFTMNQAGGHIHTLGLVKDAEISSKDRAESLFVMGRATLNFIDLCGVHSAYFDDNTFTDDAMIKAIGFKKTADGAWWMDLTDFFLHPCQHDKN